MLLQLRANMDRCIETFPHARFRELMGVPPGRLLRGPDFTRFVVEPAVLEVNGVSDIGVELALERRSRGAPIEAETVTWRKKLANEFKASLQNPNKSKVGRATRLKGVAEQVHSQWRNSMSLIDIVIDIVIVLVLLFGGGGFYGHRQGYYGAEDSVASWA